MEISEGSYKLLSYAIVATTGLKGTKENKFGVIECLDEVCAKASIKITDINRILINEATPVISELSTDIISTTTIIGSAMIGHNPDTPGGFGIGVGMTVDVNRLSDCKENIDYIVVVFDFF
jgi:diol dehydratase reactivase alpha subunit